MSEVILDTITGKSTATTITIGSTPVVSASANSMTIRGEGTAQTSIQQGLAKMFVSVNQGGSQSINESFNVSSIADGGTGLTEATLTNAHSDANYVPVATIIIASNRRVIVGSQSGHTASVVKYDVFQESTYSTLADASSVVGNTHGDLA